MWASTSRATWRIGPSAGLPFTGKAVAEGHRDKGQLRAIRPLHTSDSLMDVSPYIVRHFHCPSWCKFKACLLLMASAAISSCVVMARALLLAGADPLMVNRYHMTPRW